MGTIMKKYLYDLLASLIQNRVATRRWRYKRLWMTFGSVNWGIGWTHMKWDLMITLLDIGEWK